MSRDKELNDILEIARRYVDAHPGLMEKLRVAHHCKATETNQVDDCPFGGEGHEFRDDQADWRVQRRRQGWSHR